MYQPLCKWNHGEPPRPNGDSFRRYKEDTLHAFAREIVRREAVIEEIEERIVHSRHTHAESPDLPCVSCELDRRASAGKPFRRHILHIVRNVVPERLTEIPRPVKLHRKCGSEAYHVRIQKKWNKQVAGQTVVAPVTERIHFDISNMQLLMLREVIRAYSPARILRFTPRLELVKS